MAEALQNRYNSEEILARTLENLFHESLAEGKAIRVQACEHVDHMQALHDRKLTEAASRVKKAESLAELAQASAKHAESVTKRACDSKAQAEELHRKNLLNCEAACLARITEETLKAQLRVTEAEQHERSRIFPDPAEIASLKKTPS